MSIRRLRLKADAKEKIGAANPPHYITTVPYLVFLFITAWLNRELKDRIALWMDAFLEGAQLPPVTDTLLYSLLFFVLVSIVAGFVSVGYSWYALRISRRLPSGFLNMFDTFNMPLKVLGLHITVYVFTYLWSLLLIVPGIVAAYSYRQAFYILYDHPEYGIMDCIRASKAMMRGNKSELFVLDLSFLGWFLLGIMTMGLALIWAVPYFNVTCANYYDSLAAGYRQGGNDPFNDANA